METPVQPETLPNGVLCPKCGYDMGGLAAGVCPECGAGNRLDRLIRSTDHRDAILHRAMMWNTVHLVLLFLAAIATGLLVVTHPSPSMGVSGAEHQVLLLMGWLVGIAIFAVGRRKPDRALTRTILIRRLWILQMPWITLMVIAWPARLIPMNDVDAQLLAGSAAPLSILLAVAGLPAYLYLIRRTFRRTGSELTKKEFANIAAFAVVGWLLGMASCIYPSNTMPTY